MIALRAFRIRRVIYGNIERHAAEEFVDPELNILCDVSLDSSAGGSAALLTALAASASVKACLARQIFRSSAGRSDDSVRAAEDAFVELWRELPMEQQDRLADVLVAYARSPAFVQRRPL